MSALAADILPIRMRGTGHTRLQRAITVSAWLLVAWAAGACTGPGVEPPGGDRSETGGQAGNSADGGLAAGGGTGGTGEPVVNNPDDDNGDGDGASDAGEASPDASVDEDGGSDPQDLEP